MRAVTVHSLARLKGDNRIVPGPVLHGHGSVVKTHPTLAPARSMCEGCRDDFYNRTQADGCWHFKDAAVVDKVGHSSIRVAGGPDTLKAKTLDCWHGVST